MSKRLNVSTVVVCAFVFASLVPIKAESTKWMTLSPGVAALVDVAPWTDSRYAALTGTERDYAEYSTSSGPPTPPRTALPQAVGTRVTIVALRPDRIVAVRLAGGAEAYTYRGRLVPVIPKGTELRAAGGDGHYAFLYSSLASNDEIAAHVSSVTHVQALEMGAATRDMQHTDLIRVRVKVESGTLRGKTGWMAASSTGSLVRPRKTTSSATAAVL